MLRIGRLREFRLAKQITRAEKALKGASKKASEEAPKETPEETPEEKVEEAEEEASRDTDPNLKLTTLG
jgi:hypothetical protein